MRSFGFAVAALSFLLHASAFAQTEVRVKGSDTIGEGLGRELARSYTAAHPQVRVQWEAIGSATAFVGLLDGSAELGVSTRPITVDELIEARRLGVELREYVLGFDAIAVIVHKSNPLTALSFTQLADLFRGAVASWDLMKWRPLAVNPIMLPRYTGTEQMFSERVLAGRNGAAEKYSEVARFVEDSDDAVKLVEQNVRSIACVGLSWTVDRSQVKLLAISEGEQAPVEPSARSVHDGTYPLARPLYLYTRGDPQGPVRELVSYLLGPEGQKQVAARGFIPLDQPWPLLGGGASGSHAQQGPAAPEPPLRITFGHKSKRLGGPDRAALDRVAETLLAGTHSALIVGHADGLNPRENNPVYALDRAKAVAEYLEKKGVPTERLEIGERAETQPVASNKNDAGRQENRRVDVRLLPLPGHPAKQP